MLFTYWLKINNWCLEPVHIVSFNRMCCFAVRWLIVLQVVQLLQRDATTQHQRECSYSVQLDVLTQLILVKNSKRHWVRSRDLFTVEFSCWQTRPVKVCILQNMVLLQGWPWKMDEHIFFHHCQSVAIYRWAWHVPVQQLYGHCGHCFGIVDNMSDNDGITRKVYLSSYVSYIKRFQMYTSLRYHITTLELCSMLTKAVGTWQIAVISTDLCWQLTEEVWLV